MKVYGRGIVSEFLGDRIVFRNLEALDRRLPSLDEIRQIVGLAPGQIPRKHEDTYAQVVVHLLRLARSLDAPHTTIQRLVYIGDTRLSDVNAFSNLCHAGGWPGWVFIGSENTKPPANEVVSLAEDQTMFLSNRWSALADFVAAQRIPPDEHTAVVIDLDKTAIGARGRNAGVIDQARVTAVHQTVSGLLGDSFNAAAFQAAYDQLNHPEFHPFTADNQDYLAYICLILGSGLYDLAGVVSQVHAGELHSFEQFIAGVNQQAALLPGGLAAVHHEIYSNVKKGDPTPFKPFRRREFLATVGRMGYMGDDTDVETLLANEIVITQEVRSLALDWQSRGALIFGLSDKPDEASLPTAEQAAQGYQSIHRTPTHIVGV